MEDEERNAKALISLLIVTDAKEVDVQHVFSWNNSKEHFWTFMFKSLGLVGAKQFLRFLQMTLLYTCVFILFLNLFYIPCFVLNNKGSIYWTQ